MDACRARSRTETSYGMRCYRDLLANASERFTQEINRLGGRYAHVLDEHVDSRHDDIAGEAWLRGRFTYVLLSLKSY